MSLVRPTHYEVLTDLERARRNEAQAERRAAETRAQNVPSQNRIGQQLSFWADLLQIEEE